MGDRKNRQIVLAARPNGMPKESDFKVLESELPPLAEGQVLVKVNYLSVDPYVRGLIRAEGTRLGVVNVGEVMPGRAVGTVVESRRPEWKPGDVLQGDFGWQEHVLFDGKGVARIDTAAAPMPAWLGVLGMPGMTAYFGLLDIGRVREGETVFISGAAGAVGSVAGQIARIKGCRVYGAAGSPEKVEYLRDLGFDGAFNYRDTQDYEGKLKELCPTGIDVYFDNVGGPISDAVFPRLNPCARVVLCGQISQYNKEQPERGPRVLFHLVLKSARAEGFLVFTFAERFAEAQRALAQWMQEGRLKRRESIVNGLTKAPKAFIGLFKGRNIGKQLVRVAAES